MIRAATMDDLREVVGMGLDHHAAIQGKRYPPVEDVALDIKAFVERCINDDRHYCAVAVGDSGEPVGMMTGLIGPGIAYHAPYLVAYEISTWVKKEGRRQGHGRGLIESFYRWAEEHVDEPQMVFLSSSQHLDPKASERAYRASGFALESKTFARRVKRCRQ